MVFRPTSKTTIINTNMCSFLRLFHLFLRCRLPSTVLNKSTILKNHYYTHNLLKSLLIFTTLSFDMFPNTQKMTPAAPSTLSPGQRESLKIAYLSRFFSSYVKAILPSRPLRCKGTCRRAPPSSWHSRPQSKERGPLQAYPARRRHRRPWRDAV